MSVWIFGYGSLIWRPDFPYLDRRPARLRGWQRRFWQGSHDHRGVPERPGRVVTLVEEPHTWCDGVAFLVEETVQRETFEALDHREKNGYERRQVALELRHPWERSPDRDSSRGSALQSANVYSPRGLETAPTVEIEGVVYIAAPGNHAYLGPAPVADIAQQIAVSAGPSGHNAEYLLELAAALRALEIDDPHVFELEIEIRRLLP